ncbi:MAG: DNA replication/repair protein RecF [Dactylosporangium sp.]|nr:DNA replication/repair protein RecF [Dactylosporangium sp.]NNJ61056.1 DNA replication/repair protein RecF [Dactylosporangium sp.]
MYLRVLDLVDFRSYARATVEFEPGPSVLVGLNGAGKTNLIEAAHYIATLGSHRVATDTPLVRAGASRAIVRAAIAHVDRELLVELSIEPGKANRARLGRAPVNRTRDILGALRLVLFAPEDLSLVRGDPGERRRFLDDLLVLRQPRYAGVRADYDRVLKQRNALLRSAYLARRTGGSRGGDLSTLDVWDAHLARHGAELLAGRLELCAALGPHVGQAYDAVSRDRSRPDGVAEARMSYLPSWEDASGRPDTAVADIEPVLRESLAAARTSEIERGITLVGPHRDELVLTIGDLPVRGYASHGECWSYALALKLSAYDVLRTDGIEPVLVMDDVFAELDSDRRQRLAQTLEGASQVLVTCAVDADVPAALRGRRYLVAEGEVRRA